MLTPVTTSITLIAFCRFLYYVYSSSDTWVTTTPIALGHFLHHIRVDSNTWVSLVLFVIFCDAMVGTWYNTDVWLIAQPLPILTISKLFTKKEILCQFFHYHIEINVKLNDRANLTIEKALPNWKKWGILLSLKKNAVYSLLAFNAHWFGLKKSKSCCGRVYQHARDEFQTNLDKTYDLSHVCGYFMNLK